MNDIEQKALALVNEVRTERGWQPHRTLSQYDCSRTLTLCRAIEQHEAFRQEVSDAVERLIGLFKADSPEHKVVKTILSRFIIAKSYPLAECLLELELSEDEQEARHDAEWLVKTIEKRGGKIVWGEKQ